MFYVLSFKFYRSCNRGFSVAWRLLLWQAVHHNTRWVLNLNSAVEFRSRLL